MIKIKFISVVFFLLIIFYSCDIINSFFDDEKEEGPKDSIEKYIQDVRIAESDFKMALYAVEDGNDPLQVYDYFDWGIYQGDREKLEVVYEDGVYHAFSTVESEDSYIVKQYDLLMYFSADRLYIDSLFLTNVWDELNYIDGVAREVTFTCEVYSPIPVVTPDLDTIWENGKLEYLEEFNNELNFKSKVVERYHDETGSQYMNYPNTIGDNTYLKVYVFFRVW